MNCNNCFNKYDSNESKPEIVWPCCHTFCSKCLDSLKEQVCPECGKPIKERKINHLGLDILDQSRFMKQTLNEYLNKINQQSQSFLVSYQKKNDDIQHALSEIENQITIQTNEKIDLIYRNQNELILQLRGKGTQINDSLKEMLVNIQKNALKLDELKAALNDSNFIQNKFDSLNDELKSLEKKLNSISTQLDQVKIDFKFEKNSTQFYDKNYVGFIKEEKIEPVITGQTNKNNEQRDASKNESPKAETVKTVTQTSQTSNSEPPKNDQSKPSNSNINKTNNTPSSNTSSENINSDQNSLKRKRSLETIAPQVN